MAARQRRTVLLVVRSGVIRKAEEERPENSVTSGAKRATRGKLEEWRAGPAQ